MTNDSEDGNGLQYNMGNHENGELAIRFSLSRIICFKLRPLSTQNNRRNTSCNHFRFNVIHCKVCNKSNIHASRYSTHIYLHGHWQHPPHHHHYHQRHHRRWHRSQSFLPKFQRSTILVLQYQKVLLSTSFLNCYHR